MAAGMQQWVRRWAPRALLLVVVGAPAAASWQNLARAGSEVLGLTGAASNLPALVLDAAGAYAAVLSLRDVTRGDSAAVNRLLVWAYAMSSAALNYWFGDQSNQTSALFFAGASISAVVLWDRTLRALQRDELRKAGAVQPPTPRFRTARWIVAPAETGRAWRAAVVEGVTDPAQAVQLARRDVVLELPIVPFGELLSAPAGDDVEPGVRGELLAGVDPDDDADDAGADELPEWAALSKADAIRRALALAETDDGRAPRVIVEVLRDHGVIVPPTYVGDVARRDARAQQSETRPRLVSSQ